MNGPLLTTFAVPFWLSRERDCMYIVYCIFIKNVYASTLICRDQCIKIVLLIFVIDVSCYLLLFMQFWFDIHISIIKWVNYSIRQNLLWSDTRYDMQYRAKTRSDMSKSLMIWYDSQTNNYVPNSLVSQSLLVWQSINYQEKKINLSNLFSIFSFQLQHQSTFHQK